MTTLTCSDGRLMFWEYVEETPNMSPCVFLHEPRAVLKCTQPNIEIFVFRNLFLRLVPYFSTITYSKCHEAVQGVSIRIWQSSVKISVSYIKNFVAKESKLFWWFMKNTVFSNYGYLKILQFSWFFNCTLCASQSMSIPIFLALR